MSDKNDFDFEDDFLSDDNEPFDFEEEEGFSSGLGDEFESDMPEIEEEPESGGEILRKPWQALSSVW